MAEQVERDYWVLVRAFHQLVTVHEETISHVMKSYQSMTDTEIDAWSGPEKEKLEQRGQELQTLRQLRKALVTDPNLLDIPAMKKILPRIPSPILGELNATLSQLLSLQSHFTNQKGELTFPKPPREHLSLLRFGEAVRTGYNEALANLQRAELRAESLQDYELKENLEQGVRAAREVVNYYQNVKKAFELEPELDSPKAMRNMNDLLKQAPRHLEKSKVLVLRSHFQHLTALRQGWVFTYPKEVLHKKMFTDELGFAQKGVNRKTGQPNKANEAVVDLQREVDLSVDGQSLLDKKPGVVISEDTIIAQIEILCEEAVKRQVESLPARQRPSEKDQAIMKNQYKAFMMREGQSLGAGLIVSLLTDLKCEGHPIVVLANLGQQQGYDLPKGASCPQFRMEYTSGFAQQHDSNVFYYRDDQGQVVKTENPEAVFTSRNPLIRIRATIELEADPKRGLQVSYKFVGVESQAPVIESNARTASMPKQEYTQQYREAVSKMKDETQVTVNPQFTSKK